MLSQLSSPMAFRSLVVLFFCVVVSSYCSVSALPKGWSACKQSSLDFEDCLKNQINNAILFFKDGNRKMGIVPLSPLTFESMVVDQGGNGPVAIRMEMQNVQFFNLTDTRATVAKTDWKTMFIKFHIGYSRISGTYAGQGHVLFLPILGSGDFYIDFKNMDYTLNITFKDVMRNGKKYFQIDRMTIFLSPENVFIHLGNLFNGNQILGDTMNKFLNDNWRDIIDDMMPAISLTLGAGYKEYINRILIQIPAEEIDVK